LYGSGWRSLRILAAISPTPACRSQHLDFVWPSRANVTPGGGPRRWGGNTEGEHEAPPFTPLEIRRHDLQVLETRGSPVTMWRPAPVSPCSERCSAPTRPLDRDRLTVDFTRMSGCTRAAALPWPLILTRNRRRRPVCPPARRWAAFLCVTCYTPERVSRRPRRALRLPAGDHALRRGKHGDCRDDG